MSKLVLIALVLIPFGCAHESRGRDVAVRSPRSSHQEQDIERARPRAEHELLPRGDGPLPGSPLP